MISGVLVVTGTGTQVGKTVVVAAIAAVAGAQGRRVAVIKPAQTGVGPDEPGDIAEVQRLAKVATARELARYPDALAPATAARRAGLSPVTTVHAARAAAELAQTHDLVLVEGAGGLLVRLDQDGGTIADVAAALGAPVLVVAAAGLGTLNVTALTVEALGIRRLRCAGVVIGSWPAEPDLASICNLDDLPIDAGEPLVGALPEGASRLGRKAFLEVAREGLGPAFGGRFDVTQFARARSAGAAH